MGLPSGFAGAIAARCVKYQAQAFVQEEIKAAAAHLLGSLLIGSRRTDSQKRAPTGYGKECAIGAQKRLAGKAGVCILKRESGSVKDGRTLNVF